MVDSNQNKTLMGILSYLGVLVIIPYLVAKNNSFVKFHIKQGLILLIIEVAMWFLGMVFWPLVFIIWVVNLVVFILAIIGIINVTQGNEKKLPLVGAYAKYINI